MLCLGIESSCDESALALVENGTLLASVLASQSNVHALFGGVVPELASREHYRYLGPLFDQLMERSGCIPSDIDLVAVARGPGLLGSLLVGVGFGKALAFGLGIPFLGLNHLHAHLLAAGLERDIVYPCLGLLVSGGHTHIYRMESPSSFEQLGRTLDDAAGEAFDKIGKILGMTYPGGRLLDMLASQGHVDAALFPRPYIDNDNLDFSFSGLKTAVATYVSVQPWQSLPRPLVNAESAPQWLKDVCASFNFAVVDTLRVKVERALNRQTDIHSLVLAGGVAANTLLRREMEDLMQQRGGSLLVPSPALCTDNAAMIAYAGWLLGQHGCHHDFSMETIPRGRAIPDDMNCQSV
ncbi:MAG: tRNA (adenosine(37)-N6)-threonylcarbamoyltransferase complex transferase subunit TsaD [Desulfovibrio sp.]|nr:tRNA (adenosine(37)-N6)-threonylcarbamoyltransferase complex transferase subunit TsaD [Desulfovibrio sp.]